MLIGSSQRISSVVLGVGSIAFGVWALARPAAFASFMGADPAMGRLTGLRDLFIGSAIVGCPARSAFRARALADAWDAGPVSKPKAAVGAAAFSLWAVSAAIAARSPHTRGAA